MACGSTFGQTHEDATVSGSHRLCNENVQDMGREGIGPAYLMLSCGHPLEVEVLASGGN